MAAEKTDKCGPACPHWVDNVGELNEPACRRYETVCSAAVEKCDLVKPDPGKHEIKNTGTRSKTTWPGAHRGWGPITRLIEGELYAPHISE
jgi:hypothetical protein